MYNKTHSEETKQKMSKPVLQYSKNGVFIKEYDSAIIAIQELNLKSSSGICDVCRGNRKSAGGFVWKYKEEEKDH